MSTLLADPPATAQAPPAPGAASAPNEPAAPAAHCLHCGAVLAPGQDWCLQCGAGAPGSLAGAARSWRSTGIVIASVAVLVAGAAAAAYAAWGKRSHSPRAARNLTALAPAATPLAGSPGVGALPGAPSGANRVPGIAGLAKPPKIPLRVATPKVSLPPGAATPPAGAEAAPPTHTTTTPSNTGGSSGAALPPAIELDTNAASTYDPYSYPASNFGDPSLAIDGETATGWTAQVEPSVAPKMAEGLALDMRSARHVANVKLFTTTLGMTVQVYGANAQTLPGSITDAAWVPLSHALVIKKKSTTIKLRDTARAFRFFVLWISRAPQSAVGTPQAPGRVIVGEIELFPPGK